MSDFDSIPRSRYAAICADPPWSFATWSETRQNRAAKNHYSVMPSEDICALPVNDLAAPDCVLFLWSINSMLPQALVTIACWGFIYKTVGFTWAKRTRTDSTWHMGLGYWSRQNTESVLLATRGKPRRLSRSVRQLLVAPVGRHSEKPAEIHSSIEALVPGPYLEIFSRVTRPGWDSYGDEIGGFVSSERLAA